MLKMYLAFFLLFPAIVLAIAPPEIIEKRNLEADCIAVGKVVQLNPNDTPPQFTLKLVHVIKGLDKVRKGELIKIHFILQQVKDKKLSKHVQGILPVNISVGDMVVVYVKPSDSFPQYFTPLIQGLSVIPIQ